MPDPQLNILIRLKDEASAGLKAMGATLPSLEQTFKRLGYAAAGAGIAITGALVLSTKKMLDFGESVTDISIRTGIAIDTIQRMGYAVRVAGGELSETEAGIRQMQNALTSASDATSKDRDELARLDGLLRQYKATANDMPDTYAEWWSQAEKLRAKTGDSANAFQKLGLDLRGLQALAPEQQMYAIADALTAVKTQAEKVAIVTDIFGRMGTRLLPLMEGGAAGMRASMKKAPIMSDADIKAADAAKRQLVDLQIQAETLGLKLATTLVPVLIEVLKEVKPIVEWFAKWIEENPGMAKELTILVGGLGALMAATAPMGPVVQILAAALWALGNAIKYLLDYINAATGPARTFFDIIRAPSRMTEGWLGLGTANWPYKAPEVGSRSHAGAWQPGNPADLPENQPFGGSNAAVTTNVTVVMPNGDVLARAISTQQATLVMQRRRMGG